jgi:hypothetical protein
MQVEYSIQYASASDLTELAALALNASLPSGFRAVSDEVTLEPVTKPVTLANGSTRWRLRAERQIERQIDAAYAASMILGLNANSARAVLESNLPLESAPVISFFPSWWRWIPIAPFRVEVVME